jgi:hypothetical protein
VVGRRRLASLELRRSPLFALLIAARSLGVHDAGPLELDTTAPGYANTMDNTLPVAGSNAPYDWESIFDSTGTQTLTSAAESRLLPADFSPDEATPDATYFALSNKDIDNVRTAVRRGEQPDGRSTAKFTITVANVGGTGLTDVHIDNPQTPDCRRTKAQIPALASRDPAGTPPSGPNVTATDTARSSSMALKYA